MKLSLRLTIGFLSLIPFRVYYGISTLLYIIMYHMLGYRKKVVWKNLQHAFPEKSDGERKAIQRAFYHHLADYLVETVANFHMTINDFNKRFKLVNLDLLDQYPGKNIILAPGHYGNWEWISFLVLKIDYTCIAIYKAQSNKFVNELILHARGKYGLLLHLYAEAYRYLLSYTDPRPACLCFLADQRPAKKGKNLWVNFMNQPTAVFRGLENLQEKMNGVVLYIHIKKPKRGFYEVEFIPLNEPDEKDPGSSLTIRYFNALEANIREDPRFYLWSHNRWKFTPPPELVISDEK